MLPYCSAASLADSRYYTTSFFPCQYLRVIFYTTFFKKRTLPRSFLKRRHPDGTPRLSNQFDSGRKKRTPSRSFSKRRHPDGTPCLSNQFDSRRKKRTPSRSFSKRRHPDGTPCLSNQFDSRRKKRTPSRSFSKRRHPESNWGIKVLQTSALPLGYGAISKTS